MSTTTVETPKAPKTDGPEISEEIRLYVITKAFEAARKGGWCRQTEMEMALKSIFGPKPEGGWRDRDGFTCDGYDADGFNKDGLSRNGYDREGYGSDGYHQSTGLDRDGFDYRGRNSAGLTRQQWAQTPEGKAVEAKKLVTALTESGAVAMLAAAVAEHLRSTPVADDATSAAPPAK